MNEKETLRDTIKQLKAALENELSLTGGWGDCACDSTYKCTACQSKDAIEKAEKLLIDTA